MSDEIKEILEGIEVVIKQDGTLEFNAKELKILLDYTTNLQQYYNDNVNKYEELIEKYSNLQEKYKKIKEYMQDNLEVNEHNDYVVYIGTNEDNLLKIIGGDNNE